MVGLPAVNGNALLQAVASQQFHFSQGICQFSSNYSNGRLLLRRYCGHPVIMHAPGVGGGQDSIRLSYLRDVKKVHAGDIEGRVSVFASFFFGGGQFL